MGKKKFKNIVIASVIVVVGIMIVLCMSYAITTYKHENLEAQAANTKTFEVVVVWSDGFEQHMTQSVNVRLLANGSVYATNVTNQHDCFQSLFYDCPITDASGQTINYSADTTSSFPGYYIEYRRHADNYVVIEFIKNGTPVPPWPYPDMPDDEEIVIVDPTIWYETNGQNANGSNGESVNNNENESNDENSQLNNNSNDSNDELKNPNDMSLRERLKDFLNTLAQSWIIIVIIAGAIILFAIEAIVARKSTKKKK